MRIVVTPVRVSGVTTILTYMETVTRMEHEVGCFF